MVYVLLQFVLAAVIILSCSVSAITLLNGVLIGLGILIHIAGLIAMGWRRLSIMPQVHDKTELIRSFPYSYIRHPMYTGLIVACLGCIFAPYNWWRLLVWLGLCLTLYAKARKEERALREQFTEYHQYQEQTGMFIPWLF